MSDIDRKRKRKRPSPGRIQPLDQHDLKVSAPPLCYSRSPLDQKNTVLLQIYDTDQKPFFFDHFWNRSARQFVTLISCDGANPDFLLSVASSANKTFFEAAAAAVIVAHHRRTDRFFSVLLG